MSPRIVPDCSPEIDPANYPGPICTPHLSVLRNATPPCDVKLLSSNCWLPIVFIADDFFFVLSPPLMTRFSANFRTRCEYFSTFSPRLECPRGNLERRVRTKKANFPPREIWNIDKHHYRGWKKSANFPSPIWEFFSGEIFVRGWKKKKTDKTSHKAITKLANLFSFE